MDDDIEKIKAFLKMTDVEKSFVKAVSKTGITFVLDTKTDCLYIIFEGNDMEVLSNEAVKTLRAVLCEPRKGG